MIITVNCNSDLVTIRDISGEVTMSCKYPTETIRILEEVLSRVNNMNDEYITLKKIDEDVETTIGEY